MNVPGTLGELLLREGVREAEIYAGNGPVLEYRKDSSEECLEVRYEKVRALKISYKNLLFLQNLDTFCALEILRLDNNIIESVSNLSHLKNLKLLDLSFNNVKDVNPLAALVQIKDLSLFHNRIAELPPCLAELTNIHILSLGANKIADIAQINNLAPLKTLRSLTLRENPIASLANYQSHVCAFLPLLKYLDYTSVDPNDSPSSFLEPMQLEYLNELKVREAAATERSERICAEEKTKNFFKQAFFLHIHLLSEKMFDPTSISTHLLALRNWPEIFKTFQTDLASLTAQIKNELVDSHRRRQELQTRFESQFLVVQERGSQTVLRLLSKCEKTKKKLAKTLFVCVQKITKEIEKNCRKNCDSFSDDSADTDEERLSFWGHAVENRTKKGRGKKGKKNGEKNGEKNRKKSLEHAKGNLEGFSEKAVGASEKAEDLEADRESERTEELIDEEDSATTEGSELLCSDNNSEKSEDSLKTDELSEMSECERLDSELPVLKRFFTKEGEKQVGIYLGVKLKFERFCRKVEKMEKKLNLVEIVCHDELIGLIDDFESEMKDAELRILGEKVTDFFSSVDEMEKMFASKLSNAAVSEFEMLKSVANMEDDGSFLQQKNKWASLSSSEDLLNRCATFSEHRANVLHTCADQTHAAIGAGLRSYILDKRSSQHSYNRQRITQIQTAVKKQKTDLNILVKHLHTRLQQ